jgi:hypothetical protein
LPILFIHVLCFKIIMPPYRLYKQPGISCRLGAIRDLRNYMEKVNQQSGMLLLSDLETV